MENKKLSFADLRAKASLVVTANALNAIKGGSDTVCHDGKCMPTIQPCLPDATKVVK